jgi:formylmethanofuran dehydrogenase subunit E
MSNTIGTVMSYLDLWKKSVAFHGHIYSGFTIGYKATIHVIKLKIVLYHIFEHCKEEILWKKTIKT